MKQKNVTQNIRLDRYPGVKTPRKNASVEAEERTNPINFLGVEKKRIVPYKFYFVKSKVQLSPDSVKTTKHLPVLHDLPELI